MKKIKFALVATIVALTVCVNNVSAQEKTVTFGVKAGVNLSNFGGDMNDTKSTFKYQVGITADIALTKNLYILTGVDLQTKGAKYNPSEGASLKYNPMYLQVPVNIAYKFNLSSNTKFVVNVGPYAAYGIGGKAKGDGNSQKVFGDNRLNRLDYGVGGGIGFEFGMFSVNAGYDLGLKNISDVSNVKIKSRNAYLTLGVKF